MSVRALAFVYAAALLVGVAGCKEAARESTSVHPHAAHEKAPAKTAEGRRAPVLNTAPAPGSAPSGMVWIPGGEFWMGCEECGMPDALPVHLVSVAGFWMDATPVTNANFEGFVKATHYVTVAERKPDPRDFPGAPPDKLVPGSIVFTPPAHPVSLDDFSQW